MLTTTDVPTEHIAKLEVENLVWPAILQEASDPLLIRGSCIIQLGDIGVQKIHGPTALSSSFKPDLFRIQVPFVHS